MPLSSEAIVTLVEQHLACRNSSRLPVLVIAAAYHSVMGKIGEEVGQLNAHNAADEQTGALGDVEVYLVGQDGVATSYEMKTRRVTSRDIDNAMEKVITNTQPHHRQVDNYVFVTTEPIDADVADYARQMYEKMGGGGSGCLGLHRILEALPLLVPSLKDGLPRRLPRLGSPRTRKRCRRAVEDGLFVAPAGC